MKNLLFSFVVLLCALSATAQLYVKPTSSGDASYLYVKNELLFVKEAIDLTANPTGPTEASIYFRDESQLIQENSLDNVGTGYISILQTNADSDAWDYTYWSSPVGDQTLGLLGNTNFGTTRLFDPNNDLLGTDSAENSSTGSLDGIQSPMQISRRWLYTYTSTDNWSRINDNSVVLPGRGFTMKGLGNSASQTYDTTYDFRGRPNNGNISTPVVSGELTLSGNPYPSALDLNKVFYDNGSRIESFRYWDEDRTVNSHYYVDNKGGYGVWVPMGSDPGGTNPGMYTVAPFLNYNNNGSTGTGSTGNGETYRRRFAPVGQGFMILGGATSGNVNFTNDQRAYVLVSSADSDFRSNEVSSGSSKERDDLPSIPPPPADNRISHLRINTYFNETHLRQLVLAFSEESTDGFDRGFDASSPMDSTSDAYFPIEGENQEVHPYVIQTIPYSHKKRIPYTLVLENRARLAINFKEKVNFEGPVYLYDNIEDTYQEIRSEGGYSASLRLEAGIYEDRFFITFVNHRSMEHAANEDRKAQALESLKFFQNNPIRQLEVGNPEAYDIALANIFEMSGKLVYTAANLGNQSKFTFPTGSFSDGVYLVMLTTTENIEVNYKIIVYNN